VRKVIVGCLISVFVGCSSEDGDEAPAMPTGGSSSDSGGTSNNGGAATGGASTGGSKATGGASSGGTSAGAPGTGGRATTGGKASTGGAATGGRASGGTGTGGGTPTAPNGPVDTCMGEACPMGECDNGGFFADEKCSDVYSGPVDEDSAFCAAEGAYCLTTITNRLTNWTITCSAGTAMFDLCDGGCTAAGPAAACN
jgi:hypothetical protein